MLCTGGMVQGGSRKSTLDTGLLDHSSLASNSFQKETGVHLQKPTERFNKPIRKPLSNLNDWDWAPYKPPPPRIPPTREGPVTHRAATQKWIIPNRSFGRKQHLPPLAWHQHARRRAPNLPSVHAYNMQVRNTIHPRHARQSERPPVPLPILHQPSRPPDTDTARGQRSSSPDLLTFSEL